MTEYLGVIGNWLALFWERFSEREWVFATRQMLAQFSAWVWGPGAPIVGGLLVLVAALIVARSVRQALRQRNHRPAHDWIEEHRGIESAGRWRPSMGILHVRRRAGISEALSRPQRLKKQKRA